METKQSLNPKLERHWNKKLKGEKALAPRDVKDRISMDDYFLENKKFDKFCSDFVRDELQLMCKEFSSEDLKDSVVTVLGPGLARGLRFIPYANHHAGMKVELFDISRYAISRTNALLRSMEVFSKNSAEPAEITGCDGQTSSDTRLFVMSQFLQILPPERKNAVMEMVGRQMDKCPCRAVIVHPFNNDDDGWGDTNPYTMSELLEPAERVLGASLIVTRQKEYRYFDRHNYTAFTIQPRK